MPMVCHSHGAAPQPKPAVAVAELAQVMTLPHQLVPRFSSHLQLPRQLQLLAMAIAEQIINVGLLAGQKPQLQAAAAIYMAHFLFPRCQVEKQDIAKEAKVSGANILRCYKLISPHWRNLIPADTQAKVGERTLSEILTDE